MEDKKVENDQDIVVKKIYTSPTLTIYGKLTELTAGGTGSKTESNVNQGLKRP